MKANGLPWNAQTCDYFANDAAKRGNLGLFQWALDNRIAWDWRTIEWVNINTDADERFRIVKEELLKRARGDINVAWSAAQWEGLAEYAALFGHVQVLKRVIDRGECAMTSTISLNAGLCNDADDCTLGCVVG